MIKASEEDMEINKGTKKKKVTSNVMVVELWLPPKISTGLFIELFPPLQWCPATMEQCTFNHSIKYCYEISLLSLVQLPLPK